MLTTRLVGDSYNECNVVDKGKMNYSLTVIQDLTQIIVTLKMEKQSFLLKEVSTVPWWPGQEEE